VATLEAKQSREGKECSYIRVYANWDTPSVVQQPMRARIAGRVTPSSTQSGPASLEMIELPLKMAPSVVACCQVRQQLDGERERERERERKNVVVFQSVSPGQS
jgi:hypothetical protein